jgi:hypothetical protein
MISCINLLPVLKYAIRLPPLPSEITSALNGFGILKILKIRGSGNCSILTLVMLSQMTLELALISTEEQTLLIICRPL